MQWQTWVLLMWLQSGTSQGKVIRALFLILMTFYDISNHLVNLNLNLSFLTAAAMLAYSPFSLISDKLIYSKHD